jgi:hypothetical protein
MKKWLPYIFSAALTLACLIGGYLYIKQIGEKDFIVDTSNAPKWGYPNAKGHSNFHMIQDKKTKATMTKYITRKTPSKEISSKTWDKHLILVGGSNTFGAGLNDDESIAETILKSETLVDYDPYIMAYQGWGPNNILGKMLDKNWNEFIKESNGVMVYFFILNHIPRVCGKDSYFEWSSGVAPYYYLKGDKLMTEKFHAETDQFKKYVFKRGLRKIKQKLLNSLGVKDKFVDNPPPDDGELDIYSDECLDIFARVVAKMKEIYLKAYPGSKFLVFTFPGYHMGKNERDMQRIKKALNAQGVDFYHPIDEFIDKFKALKYEEMDIFLPDMHVNTKHHELILPLLEKAIQLQN